MSRPDYERDKLSEKSSAWLELFTLEDLQEINDDYCIEDFLPDHIIIGSNGNGELYVK